MGQKVGGRAADGRSVKGVGSSRTMTSGEAVSFSLLMDDGSAEQFNIRLDRLGRMLMTLQSAGASAQAERLARGGGRDPVEVIEPISTVGQPSIGHSVEGDHMIVLRFVDRQGTPLVVSIAHEEVGTLAQRLLKAFEEPRPRRRPAH